MMAETQAKNKKTAKYYALHFFIKIAVTAVLLWVILGFVSGIFICHDNSSYPMIKDGDMCLIYRLDEPKQGEIVVYEQDDKIKFGRVIASSGDIVDIKDDVIFVNEHLFNDETVYPTTETGNITYPYVVPENTYFLINDFREDISDSRSVGGIASRNIKGKIVFTLRRRGI